MIKNIETFITDIIGLTPKQPALYEQAFTHRSYLNEHRQSALEHNERLEFLGDAVLELVVTDYLYREYPEKNEGEMTAYRAALVNTGTLSETAKTLGLNDYLRLSKGEAKDTGRARSIILADTFEALIGAIYLDQGYLIAADFIAQALFPKTAEIIAKNLWQDAKSYFQEQAQEVTGQTPTYRITDEQGPDHNKRFTVGLYIGEELIATGQGHSKQEAEQQAAAAGLIKKAWDK
ncbi:MAG: ribonuclease III [Candidatus Paceibacterota bacterium]